MKESVTHAVTVLETDADRKVVFFSEWTDVLDVAEHLLRAKWPGIPIARIDGSVVTSDRQGEVERFQNDPHTRIMLNSFGAGGVGLNLTKGTDVIIHEPFWNFAVIRQAIARVVRLGCNASHVNVACFVSANTIEDVIFDEIAQSKLQIEKFHLEGEGTTTKKHRLDFAVLVNMIERSVSQRGENQGVQSGAAWAMF